MNYEKPRQIVSVGAFSFHGPTKYSMSLQQISKSTDLPVSVADLKAHLRITHNDEDSYLAGLIYAASDFISDECERDLVETEWCESFPRFRREITLTRYPVVSVDEVTYYDVNRISATLEEFSELLGNSCRSKVSFINPPQTAERADAVSITYTTGGVVPLAVHAIKLLAAHWYEHREAESETRTMELSIGLQRIIDLLRAPRGV